MVNDATSRVGTRLEGMLGRGLHRLSRELGGPARRRVIVLLAAVLGLQAADVGTIAALAYDLERNFHIGNPGLGLLVTVSSLVGAAGTIPMGAVADRFRRVDVLCIAIVLWAIAQAATGFATSFAALLVIRIAMGAVTASAGPVVTSLTGDLFPPKDRGRMWGFILTGEVVGTGCGIVVAGLVAGWLGWRAAFFVLAVPTLALAWFLRRLLPEPARGGQSRLEVGAVRILEAEEVEGMPLPDDPASSLPASDEVLPPEAQREFEPDPEIVLRVPPEDLNLWEAVRYVLRVKTNLVLILASGLGYFFFTGLETFAVIFVRGRYGLSQAGATLLIAAVGLGVMGGLIVAGRYGDLLITRGRIDSRLLIGTVGFLGAAALLAPGIASPWLAVSAILFVLAAAMVAAPNPGLDAARLDVVPAGMWGRAEGVRTFLRQALQAFAPLVFGLVSVVFGGSSGGFGAGVNLKHASVDLAQTHALELTFLVMLVPLVAGGLLLLRGRSSYPVDVESAAESDRLRRERERERHCPQRSGTDAHLG